MKKIIILMLVVCLFGLLLVSCGESETEKSTGISQEEMVRKASEDSAKSEEEQRQEAEKKYTSTGETSAFYTMETEQRDNDI